MFYSASPGLALRFGGVGFRPPGPPLDFPSSSVSADEAAPGLDEATPGLVRGDGLATDDSQQSLVQR
jgi:hypothetical protein